MYQKTVLPNGLRVVTETIPYVQSIVVGIWVGVGSRDEQDSNMGISHFIEHMLFKGTANRTARQIAEEIDQIGGQLNAFTAKEATCYYAKVLAKYFPVAMAILADMFFHSNFSDADIEKEKGVILEELKMYEDTPDDLIHDLFAQTIWHGHPLGRNILGTSQTIFSFTRNDIINYYRQYYTPDNTVIAVAGNLRHEEIVEEINKHFSGFKGQCPFKSSSSPVVRSDILIKKKKTEQVHLCLGTKGVEQEHKDMYTLQVLNTILGGGVSSWLFQEIREEKGLAYSVYSYPTSYRDAGLFTVYAGTSPENVEKIIASMFQAFQKLKQAKITEFELQKAKEQIKGNFLISLESVNTRMSRLGKLELFLNRFVHPDEVIEKIEQVNIENILNLSKEIFIKEYFTLAAIGPLKKKLTRDLFTL